MMPRQRLAPLRLAAGRLKPTVIPMPRTVLPVAGVAAAAGGAATKASRPAAVREPPVAATSLMESPPMLIRPLQPLLLQKDPLPRVRPPTSPCVVAAVAAAAVPARLAMMPVRHQLSGCRDDRRMSRQAPGGGHRRAPDAVRRAAPVSWTAAVVAAKPSPASVKAATRTTKGLSSLAWMKRQLKPMIVGRPVMKNCWPKAVSTASVMSRVGSRRSGS